MEINIIFIIGAATAGYVWGFLSKLALECSKAFLKDWYAKKGEDRIMAAKRKEKSYQTIEQCYSMIVDLNHALVEMEEKIQQGHLGGISSTVISLQEELLIFSEKNRHTICDEYYAIVLSCVMLSTTYSGKWKSLSDSKRGETLLKFDNMSNFFQQKMTSIME